MSSFYGVKSPANSDAKSDTTVKWCNCTQGRYAGYSIKHVNLKKNCENCLSRRFFTWDELYHSLEN